VEGEIEFGLHLIFGEKRRERGKNKEELQELFPSQSKVKGKLCFMSWIMHRNME
jgi:hypothetical protein